MISRALLAFLLVCATGSTVWAQGTQVPFGGLKHDSAQPVEIASESLSLDQNAGTAEFVGSVVAGQAELRLTANRVLVEYAKEGDEITGKIRQLTAIGDVTLVNGTEAAEAERAVYTLTDGKVRMTGSVLLTQGKNAIAGEVLNINLNTGQAVFEGRVRTIFQSTDN